MTERLKILAVHRYYWPDTPPYAAMLRRIVQRWHQDGHEVSVLSSQPSYKAAMTIPPQPRHQTLDGVRIERLSLPNEVGRPVIRVLNALRLGFSLFWRALTRRYDVIMISTAPPVLGGWFAALGAKACGARFIYHCMDLHPEVGRVSGEFARSGIYKLLLKLDNWSCRRAEPVVVLSQDMQNTLRNRPGGADLSIRVLNNFGLPSDQEIPATLPFEWPDGRLTVLFAGNIGRFQGLDGVVEAMARLQDLDHLEFVFMGEGVAKEELQRKARALGGRVRFIGHQPVEVAKAAMRRADAGFISLSADVYRYAFPSKTMTYLEQGCPLIVAVEADSELARDVVNRGYGFHVQPEDSNALAELLRKLAAEPGLLSAMRDVAIGMYHENHSEEVVLDQWSALLNESSMA